MIESLTLKNLNSSQSIDMSMYELDFCLYEGGIDWGTVNTDHNTFQYPGQVGVHISSTVVGTRDVSLNGYILAGNAGKLESKKAKLSMLINPFDDVSIIAGKYSIIGKPSTNVKFSNTYKDNNDVLCKFLIRLYCSDPLFYTTDSIISNIIEDTKPNFRFPLTIPSSSGVVFGIKKRILYSDVYNDGVVDTGGIFEITAQGTVNNPTIYNIHTNESMTIKKVLTYGERIYINTNKGSRSVIGEIDGVQSDYLRYFDFDNDWLQIHIGNNALSFKTDLDGEADLTYRNMLITLNYSTKLFNLEDE